MEIRRKIEEDFKQALREKDELTVSTLRMLKSALQNKEIEKKGKQLSDEEVLKIVAKQVQQHRDSIEQFTRGRRADLVDKESKELEILQKYLPRQLSAQEVGEVVKKVIAETGAKDKTAFGTVMKSVMAELKGRAEGKLVSQIVSAQLNLNKKG